MCFISGLSNSTLLTYRSTALAEALGLSKGTVAMWETGKRTPDYEFINKMSDMFDRKIDYILGYSDDPTSPKLTQEQIEELGKWEIQSEQIDVIRQFLRLDAYGRMNVKTLIQREFLRCLEQGTDQDISNIKIGIKTEESKSVTDGDTIQNTTPHSV